MAMIVTTASVVPPAMASPVSGIYRGMAEIEIVPAWITGVYGEMPKAIRPIKRAVEIGCGTECLPLPVQKNVAYVEIALPPVCPEHVIDSGHTHEVVEIYLIGGVILLLCEVQLVSHFVCKEESFAASLLIAHGICGQRHAKKSHKGNHYLLHRLKFLIVIHSVICCKVTTKMAFPQRIFPNLGWENPYLKHTVFCHSNINGYLCRGQTIFSH